MQRLAIPTFLLSGLLAVAPAGIKKDPKETPPPNQKAPAQKPKAAKSVSDKVKAIIVEQLGVKPEQVTPTAQFVKDLGADSLDCVELTMAFEEEFDIEIADADAEKLLTVGATVRYLEGKVAAKAKK